MAKRNGRSKYFRRVSKPGAMPGTIEPHPASAKPVIQVIAYNASGFIEQEVDNIEKLPAIVAKWAVSWINIEGLGDAETILRLGEMFNLHRLALEDAVNVHQRPKAEQYPNNLFLVARMIHLDKHCDTEQVSIFLCKKVVLTFQEQRPGDSFDPLRERLRHNRGNIRQRGADYLMYALLDSVVDAYFPVLEHHGERIEAIEEVILAGRTRGVMREIHDIKHDLLVVRRAIWPEREALSALSRDPCELISDETRLFLRDCYDHSVQLIDLLETYRELASDLRDLYLSSMSNRMNEIMKVLTIISTIFIPLTFIAGVYGMNFDPNSSPWNMPELRWYYGYPVTLLVMLAVVIGMIFYFRNKKWIGAGRSEVHFEPLPDDGPPTAGVDHFRK